MLYLELLAEELGKEPMSPTGNVRVVVPSGKCAVFDEKEFDDLIEKTNTKLRLLKKLKTQAEKHSELDRRKLSGNLRNPIHSQEICSEKLLNSNPSFV